MIVVSGTMRSGTSMWMQVLERAGLPLIGTEFPGEWRERIGDSNKNGFYESSLREGIYYRTNPHPATGAYLHPRHTRMHAVKVFAYGLVRSDVAFLDRVLLCIRPFREYVASISRLMEMERAAKSRELGKEFPAQLHVPHALRWWDENFSALRDSLIRGYPTRVIAYDTVLEDREAVARALEWIGVPDVARGVAQVDAEQRTQRIPEHAGDRPSSDSESAELPAGVSAVFDELYARVRTSKGLDESFIERLNQVDEQLAPYLEQARAKLRQQRRERKLAAQS